MNLVKLISFKLVEISNRPEEKLKIQSEVTEYIQLGLPTQKLSGFTLRVFFLQEYLLKTDDEIQHSNLENSFVENHRHLTKTST